MKKYIMILICTGFATMLCAKGIYAIESGSRPETIFKHVRLETTQKQPAFSANNSQSARPIDHKATTTKISLPKIASNNQTTIKSVVKSASSDHKHAMGKVINVKPKYITKLVPHRVCTKVRRTYLVRHYNAVPASGVLVGGIAGGLLGNQFGHGGGNILSTIGGTVLGGVVGDQIVQHINHPRIHSAYYKVCKTHYRKKSVVSGYNVTYTHDGKKEVKFMKNRPQGSLVSLKSVNT